MNRPDAALQVGSTRTTWCPACKANTGITGDMLLITPDGVSVLGTWTACEICNDPTDTPCPDQTRTTGGRPCAT